MKNKLFKIGLLSLLLPCILLVKNTNALKISNLNTSNVQFFNYSTDNPGATYTNQSVTYNNSSLYSSSIPSNKIFNVKNLVIQTNSSVSFVKDDNWDLTIYVYTFYDSYRGLNGQSLIATGMCPQISDNNSIIDECNIEYHDTVNSPIDLTNLGIITPSPGADYAVQNKIHGYYAIKLKGHFTSDGSGNTMNLGGRLLTAYNPTSSNLDLKYLIAFSTFRKYKEVPDEDKAAEELNKMNEKDEQDRNDIESQQESNEGSAEDKKDEANTTGTTLMGAFSALISALGNVHSTNCKLPNMQVYTLELKNMDLCTVNMPTGISALAGIAVSLLIVKLGISLVKRMLALYREIIG